MDKLSEILDKIAPLLYVIVPTIFGIYLNLKDKVKAERDKKRAFDIEKAKELYNIWEHEESQRVIKKIKDLCDFYKDKGHMDRVQYIQLENGTIATSSLCNMFISCLAEDNRYGALPHFISKLQRVPYSRVSCLIDKVRKLDLQAFNTALCIPNSDDEQCNLREVLETDVIKSSVTVPIYNPNEILLGACIFYYSKPNYNCQDVNDEITLINRFRSSIQSIFLEYYNARREKKEELGLLVVDYD